MELRCSLAEVTGFAVSNGPKKWRKYSSSFFGFFGLRLFICMWKWFLSRFEQRRILTKPCKRGSWFTPRWQMYRWKLEGGQCWGELWARMWRVRTEVRLKIKVCIAAVFMQDCIRQAEADAQPTSLSATLIRALCRPIYRPLCSRGKCLKITAVGRIHMKLSSLRVQGMMLVVLHSQPPMRWIIF